VKKILRLVLFIAVTVGLLYFGLIRGAYQFGQLASIFSLAQPKMITASRGAAVLVPHFSITAPQRERFWTELSKKFTPDRVMVVSVDHFGVGQSNISTTKRQWQFQTSSPLLDESLTDKLLESGLATELDGELIAEHGLTQILPELIHTWPSAKYSEVTIKDVVTLAEVNELYRLINEECPDCLLVASVDWSHYNVSSLAQLHDQLATRAVVEANSELAWRAETDSPQTMYLLTKWAEEHQLTWQQFAHSDSGLDDKSWNSETTSYMLGYYAHDNVSAAVDPVTTFMIGGDVMFDRSVNHLFADNQVEIFSQFGRRVFWGTDLALVNLEGPISDIPIDDDTNPNNLIFNFPPESAETLKYIGVNAVSLANNHTLNKGSQGEVKTVNALKQAGIAAIGHQNSFDSSSSYQVAGPVPMTVVTINTLEQFDQQLVITAIQRAKEQGQFVLVMPHWGYEYQTHHSQSQESLTKEWIAAGAGLIVGGHPHVVQDVQLVDGVLVVYSLGNLVFDQYFSAETQEGLMVAGLVNKDSVQLSFYPHHSVNSQPEIWLGADRKQILDSLLQAVVGEAVDGQTVSQLNDDTILIPRKK